MDWKTHLADIVERDGHSIAILRSRQSRIEKHIRDYNHPNLTDDEKAAISTIARSLYEAVASDVKRSTDLYWAIHQAMISKTR